MWCQVIRSYLLKASYGLPFFNKLKTLVNLNIILALLEFVVHYILKVRFTSPHPIILFS